MPDAVTINRNELDKLIRESMAAGAREVRQALGIPSDEKEAAAFVRSLHEAREFMDAWRDTKATIRRTVVKWATMLLLGAMAAAIGYGLHDKIK